MTLDARLLEAGSAALPWVWCGLTLSIGLWEISAPLRTLRSPHLPRWVANLGLTVLDVLLLRAIFPLLGVGVALAMAERDAGLLRALDTPYALAVVVSVAAQDLRAYLWHRLLHHSDVLWRLHRVHHSDVDLDFTTTLRIHPLEALSSQGLRLLVIGALGAPAGAVVLYEILHAFATFLGHANARLPAGIERAARLVFVTPDIHRVHHSALAAEASSNFGMILTLWDRLFGSFRAEPAAGHAAMTVGLPELQDPAGLSLASLLLHPFVDAGRGAVEPEAAES